MGFGENFRSDRKSLNSSIINYKAIIIEQKYTRCE